MDTKSLYSQFKNSFFIVCFTIMNRVSYLQIAIRKINKQYNFSSFVPSFLKHKKTSPEQSKEYFINPDYKLVSNNINNITYYKMVFKDNEPFVIKPCDYNFTSINLTDITENSEKDYEIDICNEKINYFCVGNKLDKYFLSWYLQKFHNTELPQHYKLSIIDNDCEIIDLESDKTIVFHEKNYEVV